METYNEEIINSERINIKNLHYDINEYDDCVEIICTDKNNFDMWKCSTKNLLQHSHSKVSTNAEYWEKFDGPMVPSLLYKTFSGKINSNYKITFPEEMNENCYIKMLYTGVYSKNFKEISMKFEKVDEKEWQIRNLLERNSALEYLLAKQQKKCNSLEEKLIHIVYDDLVKSACDVADKMKKNRTNNNEIELIIDCAAEIVVDLVSDKLAKDKEYSEILHRHVHRR